MADKEGFAGRAAHLKKKKKTWDAREEEHLFQNQCFLTV